MSVIAELLVYYPLDVKCVRVSAKIVWTFTPFLSLQSLWYFRRNFARIRSLRHSHFTILNIGLHFSVIAYPDMCVYRIVTLYTRKVRLEYRRMDQKTGLIW